MRDSLERALELLSGIGDANALFRDRARERERVREGERDEAKEN